MKKIEQNLWLERCLLPPQKTITSFFKPNKVQNSTENVKISNSGIVVNTCPVNNEKDFTLTRLTSNAATAPKDREKYLTEREHVLLINIFLEIGVKDIDKFLSNDLRNDETLVKCLTTFAYTWNNFSSIEKEYMQGKSMEHKSNLSTTLKQIDEVVIEVKKKNRPNE